MTETLVLAALLSSPSWPARDAATAALAARPGAAPVLHALERSPDPEVRMRSGLALQRLARSEAVAVLTGPGDVDAAAWAPHFDALEGAARRLGCIPPSFGGPSRHDAAGVRQLVGWSRNQLAFPPGHPLRWSWPVSWEFASTGWKW